MRYFILVPVILFTFSSFALANDEPTSEKRWIMNLNGILGVRVLDSGDWSPDEVQLVGGVEFDFAGKEWPFSLLVGTTRSGNGNNNSNHHSWGSRNEAYLTEGYVGIRKYLTLNGRFFPYISAGGSYIAATVCDCNYYGGTEQTDYSFGYFGSVGGIYKKPMNFGTFNIGFDIRGLAGTSMELRGKDVKADNIQTVFVMGYGW